MVKKLLERAIEIEGLLRIIRDGNPLPETYSLLSNKAVELAEEAMLLEEKSIATEPEAGDQNPEAGAPTSENECPMPESGAQEAPMIVMTTEEAGISHEEESKAPATPAPIVMIESFGDVEKGNSQQDDLAEAEEDDGINPGEENDNIDPTKEDGVIITDEDDDINPEEEENGIDTDKDANLDPAEENVNLDTDEDEDEDINPDREEDAINSGEEDDDIVLTFEDDEHLDEYDEQPEEKDDLNTLQITSHQIKVEDAAKLAMKRPVKLISAFSLNDRFLYSRELFEGNMKMFDSTLDFIEGIDEYSIIEDYFYSELEWDPEDRTVASFMDILRPHFKD